MGAHIRELKDEIRGTKDQIRELKIDELERVSGGCDCCHCDSGLKAALASINRKGI